MKSNVLARSTWPLSSTLALLLTGALGCGADDSTSSQVSPITDAGGGPSSGLDASTSGQPDAGSAPPGPVGKDASVGVITVGADAALCTQFTIENGRITPDMLIVLDRSSSMRGQGVDRWTPSVSGLKAITDDLDDVIRFGLMAFPGRGTGGGGGGFLGGGGGGTMCAAGTLEVPIAIRAAPAIATSLDGLELVGTTPTALTLEAAHTVLGSGMATLDMVSAARYVILVTDGAPNCSNGAGGGGGGGMNDAEAVAASVAAIAAMQKDGIKTYVVGYDTQNDATLKAALDQMAQAGGTGDTTHRAIENEAELVAAFRKITGSAVGCEYELKPPPTDPNYVLVQLDNKKLDLNAPGGFTLSPDNKTVTIVGAACEQLKVETGAGHALTVRVECERQTPLL